jgi:hypothetical protein
MTTIVWLLKFGVIWFGFDVLVIATAWYLVGTIKPHFPNWWRQVVANEGWRKTDDPSHYC